MTTREEDTAAREEMIAQHDALVEKYNALPDDATQEEGDAILNEIGIMELHLCATAPPMSDEDFAEMLEGNG
jgi:hypothetical protein